MTTSGADGMPPFSRTMAVLKAGIVDGVSWMIHGTPVFNPTENYNTGRESANTAYD
jgi:hypothetical protein